MNKEIVGTVNQVINVSTSLKIPVAQSYLPILNIKQPNADIPKQKLYSNHSRDPFCVLKLKMQRSRTITNERQIEISKNTLVNVFSKLQSIQNQLNTYM